MDTAIVIGLVIAVTELLKKPLAKVMDEDTAKKVVPIIVLLLAGGLNALASYLFTPDIAIRQAIIDGLTLGATAGGIYGMGKALLGKS